MTRVCVFLFGFLSASCDVSTIELLADLADGSSPLPDASGGLTPSGDGSPGVVTPECTDDMQCASSHCDLAKQYCVECLDDAHCAADEICNESSGQCLTVCTADGDCAGETASLCDTGRGFCVECNEDAECTSTAALPLCFGDTGQCVQCLDDGDCTGTEQYCSIRFHSCDACLQNAHCAVSEVCNMTTGSCMAVDPL